MRLVVAPMVVAALVLCFSGTAAAGAGDGTYDAEASATPTATGVVVDLRAWSDGGTVSVGPSPLAQCTFVTGLTGPAAIDLAGGRGILIGITDPEMEQSEASYTFVSCPEPIFDGFGWAVWEETEPPPPAVIDAVARAARSAIQVPDLTPRSAPDGLLTPFLTQLPVWLWLDRTSWVPVSGTAAIPEIGLSVTATATPITTDWLAGSDRTPTAHRRSTSCAAGTPFTESPADTDTGCTLTFAETTEPDTTVDLSVTATYRLTFVCTPGLCDPAAIALPDLAVTVTRPVTITEARGVIVR